MTDNRRLPMNEEGRMDNTIRDGSNIIPRNNNMPAMNTGNVPTHYTGAYRDDYRDIYRGYRYDRRNNKEMNIFKSEENYKPYNDADEIFETIVAHLTKGVKFHDRMMDLYAFLGLYGFKKMHEYQYLSESMERRQTKCYIIDHMNILVEDKCDEKGLDFIPKAWHNYSRQDIPPESRQQYIEPSFQGYKQWEEETKELLSYCANELMYMGKMADFNEVMEMIEDVDKELEHLEKLMLKLKSVDYNIEYVMDMQEQLCDEYNEKIEQLFVEKLEEDKIKRKHKTKYSMEEQYQRRSARTGRYIRG
jgi:hypothetical protein